MPGAPMGAGAGGLHALDPVPALRPGAAALAEPRPLRALQRPRLDAALCAAVPRRRRGGWTRKGEPLGQPAVGLDDIKQLPPAGQRLSGPSRSTAITTGVETTTGPLGQGVGNQRRHGDRRALAGGALQHAEGHALFDYNVYAICSDGDLMEGDRERGGLARRPSASSPTSAGSTTTTTSPSKADTELAFTEDVAKRFDGYGWAYAHGRGRQRLRGVRRARSSSSWPPPSGRR